MSKKVRVCVNKEYFLHKNNVVVAILDERIGLVYEVCNAFNLLIVLRK